MNLYRKLDTSKYQFDFLYFSNEACDYDDEIIALGGRIFRILANNPISRTNSLYQFLKKENSFYAVQCHQMFSNGLHLVAAKYAGIPMRISHSHNTSDIKSDKLIGKIYHGVSTILIKKYSTHFIACGDAAGQFLFPNIENIMLLPNAINLDSFLKTKKTNPALVFKNKAINNKTIVISQIGRLNKVKNHSFSLKLVQHLKKCGVNFQFIITGTGPLETQIKQEVLDLNLVDYVTFAGVRSDIDVVLANSDIMLMPSLFEGFPVVLVEAQASATPCLISNNISKEVDMGLGLVHFCDLKNDLNIWTEKINQIIHNKIPSATERKTVFNEQGYNIELSIKKLERFYENGK